MNTQHSFIKGTAILIIANAISKILGAIFKIPLTYILNEEGMAIFNTAMGVYQTILSFVISGLPLALSRLCAEDFALKNYTNLKKTVAVSSVLLCVFGFLGSGIMYLFADFFALAMKDPKAALAIKILSPSVFFVAWGNVYKSYYQGCVNMFPTAISQIIEAFVRLIVGFGMAYFLRNKLLEITSAGAISGITIGEITATSVLFIMFIPGVRSLPNSGNAKRYKKILNSLSSVAVPMLIFSCISGVVGLLDTATVRNALLHIQFDAQSAEAFLLKYSSYTDCFDNLKNTLRLSVDGARWLFGAYSGFALTLFHLPVGIISALGTGVLPVISGALAKNDVVLAKKTTSLALQITLIIALACAVVLGLFGEQLLEILFNNTSSAILLKQLSPCLVFLCVSQLLTVILHASGKIAEPFLYNMIGMAIKLCANLFLIPIPKINISGAVIGSSLEFFVVMILDIYAVKKCQNINFEVKNSVVKPLLSAVIMALVMILINNPFSIIFKNIIISTGATLVMGGVVYLLSLFGFGVLNFNAKKD